MTVFGNIARKVTIRALMLAQQTIVTVTYPYLCMRSLKDCRLTALCVNYGILVAIVLYVVVVRDLADCFVVAYREDFMW